MKAIMLRKTGGPEVLKVTEVPEPEPGPGQVRVQVHYTAINYADILSRKGLYQWAVKRPYILGLEAAGVIDAVGEGVDLARVGETVIVGAQNGCYAEKVVVPSIQAIPAIEGYSLEENAAFLVNYMTAYVAMVPLARLQSGEKVLISAAAGGVGTAAVQIGAHLDCPVYGLAGNAEKIAFVKKLGAAEAFNYREPNWHEQVREATGGVDYVLEVVGGEVFRRCIDLLNPFGRLVVVGFASLNLKKWNPYTWWKTWRDMPRPPLLKMSERSLGVMATHLGYLLADPPRLIKALEELRQFVTGTDIRPVIGRIFPFEQAAEAHAFIESRQSIGKVLLKHNV
ncbi:MAG: NADPH:quinone oxidoreductase family protein [Calditrichaeota bacterium]|nr:MAG: NADPH:quinone oxidoreductase family protein [Calditrichota bacterium]